MTEPATPPIPLGWPANSVIWCTTCGIHLALASQPLCPVCLDEKAKAIKA